ncbi:MAG TPA: hypothetical protein VM912_08745 [Terriglobales bacterium]|nr:hypothetical protein [Terriglobales bacterium]
MKAFSWFGVAVLIVGIVLLFVPIPHKEKHGIRAGDVSLGVETRSEEKASPAICAALIVVGLGLVFAGRMKS